MPEISTANTIAAVSSPVAIEAIDIAGVDKCTQAIALLERIIGWNDQPSEYPGDSAADEILHKAWALTHQAMAADVTTLAGVRAQVALLLLHHECQGNGPEHPEIEMPPLRNLLRLLPANA